MGRPAAAVSLFDDAAAATLASAGGAASMAAATALVESLRAAALSRVLTTGEVPTLACLADRADCGPASAAAARALQSHGASVATSAVVSERNSADGSTTKLLLRLHDGLAVEAVLLRHDSGAGRYAGAQRPSRRRATLCVSSQAGCAMGCTFCATGRLGLQRNLSAGEIAEQALQALARSRVPLPMLRNVVFMGMGEPLNNYGAVISAIKLLTAAPRLGGFGVARSRVTVSTVGIVPRMRTLAADAPGVRLALSLHAPSQAEREALVPSASTFALPALLEAAAVHAAAPGGAPPLIEYVLLRGVNDSAAHAAALGALLAGRQGWAVNLIPFNRVPGAPYEAPAAADVVAFQAALRTDFGINATVRRAMGQDIAGACGQLAAGAADIEDLPAQVALMAC